MAEKKNKDSKIEYTYNGKTYHLAQLCAALGLKYSAVYDRLQKGMDINEAVSECAQNPRTWGRTYSNKSTPKGMPNQNE